MIFYLIVLTTLFVLPIVWLNYIFKKNDKILVNMPFNAIEFGNILLNEKGLQDVKIEETKLGDHYDLNQKKVKVLSKRLTRKSLTSITIMCHEIGHAIQHSEKYKPLERRTKIVKSTMWITQLGNSILLFGLPIIFATGSYSLIKLCVSIAVISIIIGIIVHLITLEVEIDASFNKALPIILEKIPQEYHEACKSILWAAALTYLIGVIRSFLSLRFIWLLMSRIR